MAAAKQTLTPVFVAPSVNNYSSLSSVAITHVPDGTPGPTVRRVCITNPNTSGRVFFMVCPISAGTPSFSAPATGWASDAGIIVLPGTEKFINLDPSLALYILASGASVDCQVTIFDDQAY